MLSRFKTSLLLSAVGLLTACARADSVYTPTFGPLTDEIIPKIKTSNPIIVVPGIGGTQLVDAESGKTAWGSYGFNTYWPSTEKDNQLLSLPLEPENASSAQEFNKAIPKSVLETWRLSFFPFSSIEFAVYATIKKSMIAAGYISEKEVLSRVGYTKNEGTPLFEFAYDWRKSNAENAVILDKFVREKSENPMIKKHFGDNQKFDLICHSMGCLVSRYYLRYGNQGLGTSDNPPELDWRGSDKIENIIMVAPPNKGSVEALSDLTNGFYLHQIKLLKYPPAVLGTWPSMYELLPRQDISQATNHEGKEVDLLDPQLWQDMSWGLLDPNQEKVLTQISSKGAERPSSKYLQAKRLQAKLLGNARLFHSRLDKKVESPKGLYFWLFAGVGKPTESKVTVNTENKTWSAKREKAGDGAVLRASAYTLENTKKRDIDSPYNNSIIPWYDAIFFFTDHMGLVQNNDFFLNLYDIIIWRSNF